jgi:hypothetical protein
MRIPILTGELGVEVLTMIKRVIAAVVVGAIFLFSFTQLHIADVNAQGLRPDDLSTTANSGVDTQAATAQPTGTPAPYTLIFSGEPGPDVSTLQEIAADANTDDDFLKDVADYYHENQDRLSILWREDNPTRLAGIFSMYVVHISTIYGATTRSMTNLVDYLSDERAQCGTYTWMQFHIAGALGLTWRTVEFVGEHAWLEIYVDDHWEAFDATTNTWLSRGVDELMQGMPRQYRQFYSPMLDATRPDARLHMAEGYNMQKLRQQMPGVGITYMPPGQLNVSVAVVN